MSKQAFESRGRYFEEFAVGDILTTPARTITEADVVNFAALSGDWNQLHTDAEYAKETPFGTRIAHGLLGLTVASGLGARLGFIEGTAEAFLKRSSLFFTPHPQRNLEKRPCSPSLSPPGSPGAGNRPPPPR